MQNVDGELVLTSGSDLNPTAVGPWPGLRNASTRLWNSWHANSYRPQEAIRESANYGEQGSRVGYHYKWNEYPQGPGLYPGPVPNAQRPTYDNVLPIVWHLRVGNPNMLSNQNLRPAQVIQVGPSEYVPAGVASLAPEQVS